MSASLILIPRVFLKPASFQASMYHTARAPAPVMPNTQPGADQPQVELIFEAGVAYNVPKTIYDIFADLGIATTERPLTAWEKNLEERLLRPRSNLVSSPH